MMEPSKRFGMDGSVPREVAPALPRAASNAAGLRVRSAGLLALALAAHGCITGKVLDPATDRGIAGTTVRTYAKCTGAGCTVQGEGWQSTTTSADGDFLYDAYGDSRAYLEPALDPLANACGDNPSHDALEIQISAPGFEARTVFHRPSYKPYIDPETGQPVLDESGNPKLYSALPRPVYLCPEGAPDSDSDTVCDVVEQKYGTDPNDYDSDHDALDDAYELFGHDHLDLASYGADPLRKDIFVEIDFYPGHQITKELFQDVVTAFDVAPVRDGNPNVREGISLHIEVDDQLAPEHADPNIVIPLWIDWSEFDAIKRCYFEPHRSPAFHYALFADQLNHGTAGGQSRFIPGHDFIVAVPGVSDHEKAATLMHELGHNLGLNHGGAQFDAAPYKPNYLSIMSYLYAFSGVVRDDKWALDYSRTPIAPLRESSLSEARAMEPADPSVSNDELARYRVLVRSDHDGAPETEPILMCLRGNAGANLDFNGPRTPVDTTSELPPCTGMDDEPEADFVTADLNANGTLSDAFPTSQNDWDVLWFWGNGYDGGAFGIPRPGIVHTFAEDPATPDDCPLPR